MSSFGVVLDANVLIKAGPRDTLLRAAERELYRPYWSEALLDEVQRNLADLLAKRSNSDPVGAARRLIEELREQFPEALVGGYEALVPVMTNPEKDRHVLAAAVVAQAQVIVTDNLRDFPAAALRSYGLEARTSDTFLTELFDLYPLTMVQILTQQGSDLRHPRTLLETLDSLASQAPRFAQAVRLYLQTRSSQSRREEPAYDCQLHRGPPRRAGWPLFRLRLRAAGRTLLGDTVEDAPANIAEAIVGLLEAMQEDREQVPIEHPRTAVTTVTVRVPAPASAVVWAVQPPPCSAGRQRAGCGGGA